MQYDVWQCSITLRDFTSDVVCTENVCIPRMCELIANWRSVFLTDLLSRRRNIYLFCRGCVRSRFYAVASKPVSQRAHLVIPENFAGHALSNVQRISLISRWAFLLRLAVLWYSSWAPPSDRKWAQLSSSGSGRQIQFVERLVLLTFDSWI